MHNQYKNEPLWKRILREDRRYSPDGLRRINTPIGRFPPDDDYVVIKDNIPDDTKKLFELCKSERLLEGIIQFHSYYYSDESYAKYIDFNAKRWFELLDNLEGFWYGNETSDEEFKGRIELSRSEYEEYTKIKDMIWLEIHRFLDVQEKHKNAKKTESINNILGYKGESRFAGKDVPQKIDILEVDNELDFP